MFSFNCYVNFAFRYYYVHTYICQNINYVSTLFICSSYFSDIAYFIQRSVFRTLAVVIFYVLTCFTTGSKEQRSRYFAFSIRSSQLNAHRVYQCLVRLFSVVLSIFVIVLPLATAAVSTTALLLKD